MKIIKNLCALTLSISLVSTALTANNVFATSYPVGGAYSMGGEFLNGADVISACDYWGLCGYDSYYNINPSYSYLNSNRLNAYVVYFSAHGNQDAIYLPNNLKLTDGYILPDSNTVEISDFDLDRPKLYVYDACLTASNGDGTGINLCTETISAGVDCVIGWTQTISDVDSYAWEQRFQNQLALGWSVQNAANYANGFSYIDNTAIKSWLIYGNNNMVVKTTSASPNNSNIYTEKEEFEYYDFSLKNQINIDFESNDYTSILKSYFKDFNERDYDISYTYTNEGKTDYVVDYSFKYGEYSTKIGYTIIVNNNDIVGVQANNIEKKAQLEEINISQLPEIKETTINIALNKATNELNNKYEFNKIVEQTGEPYYDIETSKFFYSVKTVYQLENGGYGSFFTFEEM